MKETTVDAVALIDTIIPPIGIGKDRLWTMLSHRFAHAGRDGRQGFVPRNSRELGPWSFWTKAFNGKEQTVWSIDTVEQFVDFGAECATGEWMFSTGGDFHGFAVVNRHFHEAGVWAVVWASDLGNMCHTHSPLYLPLPQTCRVEQGRKRETENGRNGKSGRGTGAQSTPYNSTPHDVRQDAAQRRMTGGRSFKVGL